MPLGISPPQGRYARLFVAHHTTTRVVALDRLRCMLHNTRSRGRLHRSHGPSRRRHPQPRSSAVRASSAPSPPLYHKHHPPLLTDNASYRWRRSITTLWRAGSQFYHCARALELHMSHLQLYVQANTERPAQLANGHDIVCTCPFFVGLHAEELWPWGRGAFCV